MSEPAYTRMEMHERRRQLLGLATELFARDGYQKLSMSDIAAEAGISKALLYHYFPSKHALYVATLQQSAQELARATEPPSGLPPAEALTYIVEAFLSWIEQHETAYRELTASAGSTPEVAAQIAQVRDRTADRILAGLGTPGVVPSRLRVVARSWLWQMDGAIFDWLEHRDLTRSELSELLVTTLGGALQAALAADPAASSDFAAA